MLRYRKGQKRVDWGAMLAALQAAEERFSITNEHTLWMWVNNEVIGPEDMVSIVAVGKVVNSRELVRLAPQIDKAFRRMRGIRQGIGRRLNGLIRRVFQIAATGQARDEIALDDHLLLPLDELLESVDLARVVEVGATEDVPSQWLRRWRAA